LWVLVVELLSSGADVGADGCCFDGEDALFGRIFGGFDFRQDFFKFVGLRFAGAVRRNDLSASRDAL